MSHKIDNETAANECDTTPNCVKAIRLDEGSELKDEPVVEQSAYSRRNQQTNYSHRIAWMIGMFICSALYLFPEAIFNVSLVEVAGGTTSGEDELRNVELFGRAISGIGVSLLIIDAWFSGKGFKNLQKTIAISAGIIVLIWPLVFFGQKIVVDKFLINASTAKERQEALFLQVARKALILNTITIEGVDYDPHSELTAADKTFISIFPGVVLAEGSLINHLSNQKETILRKYIKDEAYKNFDENYGSYKILRSSIKEQFDKYSVKSKEYTSVRNSWKKTADDQWFRIQEELLSGWTKYKKAAKAFDARIEARAQEITPKLVSFFKDRNECMQYESEASRRCYTQYEERYNRKFRKPYKLNDIEANDFLMSDKYSHGGAASAVLLTTLTDHLSDYAFVIDNTEIVNGREYKYVHKYSRDYTHYKSVLNNKMSSTFLRESNGYPPGIANISEFKKHPKTVKRLKSSLSEQGISVASSWTPFDRKGFSNAIKSKVHNEAKSRWNTESKKQGIDIPPNLSWSNFQKTKHIQQRILDEMGDNYVPPIMATWNNKQFLKYVVEPNIDRKTREYLQIMESQLQHFEDGEKYEDLGKSALRSTVVPPISMAISLFLVILTALKLPLKLIEIMSGIYTKQIGSMGKLVKFAKGGYTLFCFYLIFLLPSMLSTNQFNAKDSAISYYTSELKEAGSSMVGHSIDWAIATQPAIKPIGDQLENKIGLFSTFKGNHESLDNFDNKVLSSLGFAH